MASGTNGSPENAKSPVDVTDGQQPSPERTEDRNKTPRHPRWTRQETVVLIEGKKIAEERGRRGRRPSTVFGSDQPEPKWDSVSSFCRRNGVNRGPVQCRKRWSNLVSDFKKIKLWESQDRPEGESFWMMRSDLRRERRLPGFFDREVYDVLDGKAFAASENQLALVVINADGNNGERIDDAEADDEDEMTEDDEPLKAFSEFEQVAPEEIGKEKVMTDGKAKSIPSPVPISGTLKHSTVKILQSYIFI
ncbi:hypothetical protein CDL12_11538 [Handroanthus impetiginosus]|uniref:Myb-like domain-containing protein n=1 Tax=Handroanthus impetiginosus TaxID=429701 RepID=A0A2G9HE59_9LAMI|nr:hypothetical protein CDL12_11538 [Handroanthus impetiginosus]